MDTPRARENALALRDLRRVATRLQDAFEQPLPGLDAHLVMAPKPRAGWKPLHVPPDVRQAAALLLLYEIDGCAAVALTVRASTLPHHGGQVSLPGGALEPGESIEDGAVREAVEEVGIDPADVRVLGRLSPLHIPVSGFVLHPVVAIGRRRPDFAPHAPEVSRLLEVELPMLADPATLRLRWRTHEGRNYEVPYFSVGGEQVWGATAMVLGELLAILGAAPELPGPAVGTAPPESRPDTDSVLDDEAPPPCPRCGDTGRLFTPNAQRDPSVRPPAYEAAWQCVRCGLVEFLGR